MTFTISCYTFATSYLKDLCMRCLPFVLLWMTSYNRVPKQTSIMYILRHMFHVDY